MPSIVEITRTVLDVAAASASAEDKAKLYEVSSELNRLKAENDELMRENGELREMLQRRKALERHDGGYYVFDGGGFEEGPICPECYEAKGFVYLLETNSRGARCSVCGNHYAGAQASVEGYHSRIG